jgi:hypothetical protein
MLVHGELGVEQHGLTSKVCSNVAHVVDHVQADGRDASITETVSN